MDTNALTIKNHEIRFIEKIEPANKKSSSKMDLEEEKYADSGWKKSATQKGRRKCADLRGRVTVSYSAWCRPVESMSTGGSPSRVEK